MLPVLEDPLLAQRAGEHRFGVRDLLLYSAVCGTGLDVVPLPGDTSSDRIARLLRDVGALSAKLRKPLSARLFLVPGKKAGDIASESIAKSGEIVEGAKQALGGDVAEGVSNIIRAAADIATGATEKGMGIAADVVEKLKKPIE